MGLADLWVCWFSVFVVFRVFAGFSWFRGFFAYSVLMALFGCDVTCVLGFSEGLV